MIKLGGYPNISEDFNDFFHFTQSNKPVRNEMILTDLNIDCLEGILGHLELADLLNVADSNNRMRHASKYVFVNKYRRHRFSFIKDILCHKWTIFSGENHTIHPKYAEFRHISSNNFKSILQTLRVFGSLISVSYTHLTLPTKRIV